MTATLGGNVARANKREYGTIDVSINNNSLLFKGFESTNVFLMSHTDFVEKSTRRVSKYRSYRIMSKCCYGKSSKKTIWYSISSRSKQLCKWNFSYKKTFYLIFVNVVEIGKYHLL